MYKQVNILRTRNKQIKRVVSYYDEFIVIQFKDQKYSIISTTTGWEGEDKLWLDCIFDINSGSHKDRMIKKILKKLRIISNKQIQIADEKSKDEGEKERYKEYLILKEEFEKK